MRSFVFALFHVFTLAGFLHYSWGWLNAVEHPFNDMNGVAHTFCIVAEMFRYESEVSRAIGSEGVRSIDEQPWRHTENFSSACCRVDSNKIPRELATMELMCRTHISFRFGFLSMRAVRIRRDGFSTLER